MDHLLQPTLSWVSGSAHPADPVCEIVAIVTSHLFSSEFGRTLNKMVHGLQDQTLFPHTSNILSFPKQPGQHGAKAVCDVDLMV